MAYMRFPSNIYIPSSLHFMTKVRTVVPANATPGRSLLQVVNPKSGKSVRVKVPADAVPGAMIELQLPDEPETRLPPRASLAQSRSPQSAGSEPRPATNSDSQPFEQTTRTSSVQYPNLVSPSQANEPISTGDADSAMKASVPPASNSIEGGRAVQPSLWKEEPIFPVASIPPVTQMHSPPPFDRAQAVDVIHADKEDPVIKRDHEPKEEKQGFQPSLRKPEPTFPIASIPPPTQMPSPPPFDRAHPVEVIHADEAIPLIKGYREPKEDTQGSCGSCLSNPISL